MTYRHNVYHDGTSEGTFLSRQKRFLGLELVNLVYFSSSLGIIRSNGTGIHYHVGPAFSLLL